VFVVAILELAGALEDEAAALAADLGSTAYEVRLILAAGTPSVVLQTAEKERAVALLGRIRARQHGAAACDDAAVVSSADMKAMRDFTLGADALIDSEGDPMAYDDLLALVPAVHKKRTETQTESRSQKFSPFAAMASGGLVMRRESVTTTRERTDEREHVLYMYRRGGGLPWILREQGSRYTGLGAELGRTQRENFLTTIKTLRARAPWAAYDERLLTIRRVPERSEISGGASNRVVVDSSVRGTDLLAHFVALWAARQSQPHR
jgi:hypothetical protein